MAQCHTVYALRQILRHLLVVIVARHMTLEGPLPERPLWPLPERPPEKHIVGHSIPGSLDPARPIPRSLDPARPRMAIR
jgi:hypothetical protein